MTTATSNVRLITSIPTKVMCAPYQVGASLDRTPFSGPLLVRGSCLDSISQGFYRFGWGAVPQRAVRPFVVVVVPPVLDQDFRFM